MTKSRDDMKKNRRLLWQVDRNPSFAQYRERLEQIKKQEKASDDRR